MLNTNEIRKKIDKIATNVRIDSSTQMILFSFTNKFSDSVYNFEITESASVRNTYFAIISKDSKYTVRCNYFGDIDKLILFISHEFFENFFNDTLRRNVIHINADNGDKVLMRIGDTASNFYLGRKEILLLLKKQSVDAYVTGHEREGGISISFKKSDLRIIHKTWTPKH